MQYMKTAKVLRRRNVLEHPFGEAGVNRCLWMEMLHEYAEPPLAAMDAIVEHLLEHAHPGDLVWTGYGDLPILFHTETRVVSWYMTCLKPNSYKKADWILPRGPAPFYLFLDGRLRLAGAGKFTKDFSSFLDAHFECVVLPVTDILGGNGPDPDVHGFRRSFAPPHVVFYQRVYR